MNKTLVFLMLLLLSFSTNQLFAQEWKIYRADVLPAETAGTGDTLDITVVSDNSPGAGMIQEIIDDQQIAGNKILKYLHPDGKTMFRNNYGSEYAGTEQTFVARIKGENDPVYQRAFDIHWRNGNGGVRDELRIWPADSTLELEKADVTVKVNMDLYEWHTYRVVISGDSAVVYVDENDTPVISGVSAEATTDNYIKIGDGSGDTIGGYLDWCVLDLTGGYAPGEGAAFPDDLFVDGINLLPEWLVYDGSILPGETVSGEGLLDINVVSDNSPGAGMVQEIIDDTDIDGNKILKYLHPDGKTMFRHNYGSEYAGAEQTFIARIKGENDAAYDRAFDIQWRNGNAGVREDLRIWPADSTIELEKANVSVKVDLDLYEWHTYRIVISGDSAVVYVDENETPVVSGVTSEATTDKYVKLGDGSGENIGGYLDWCILDLSGGYAPGDGLDIPAELFVDGRDQLPLMPGWLVYDGGTYPGETVIGDGLLDLATISDNSPGAGMIQEIIDDPVISGNKIFKYLHPDGKMMFRHNFGSEYTGTEQTLIARISGENDPAYDRIFDLQWRNGNAGVREELRIWPADSTIELEKANITAQVDMNLYYWHTYRIAIIGDSCAVYIDENPEPVITGVSAESTSDNYIKIGDGSGEAIGGYLDWCILDLSGAYAPGEGADIPAELYVDDYQTDVEDTDSSIPTDYSLAQNYPNPFNPTTTISFRIPQSSVVKVDVFNTLGQHIATLVNEQLEAGAHKVTFDASNIASGVYFYSITANDFTAIKKMMLLK